MNTSIDFRDFLLGPIRKTVAAAGLSAIILLAFGFEFAEAYPPGNCIDNAATTDYVSVGPLTGNDMTFLDRYRNFTVEAWVMVPTLGEGLSIAIKRQDSGDGWHLYVHDTGQVEWWGSFTDDTQEYAKSQQKIEASKWIHIAGVVTDNRLILYFNGHEVAEDWYSGGLDTAPEAALEIAKNAEGTNRILVDEFRYWERALTQDEIDEQKNTVLSGYEDGLLVYYDFDLVDTASKTVKDRSVNGLDATFQGTDLAANLTSSGADVAVPEPGIGSMTPPGNALEFDGANEFIDCGNIPALQGDVSYTKEAWVKSTRNDGTRNVVSGVEKHALYIEDGVLKALSGTNNRVNDSEAMDLDVWYHVAVTYDAATDALTLYKNGDIVDSKTTSVHPDEGAVLIGAYNQSNFFAGHMDEVRVWSIARTQEELLQNMNRVLTGDEPGLEAYYDFDRNEGYTMRNMKGNHRNTGLLYNMEDEDWLPSGVAISADPPTGWVYFDDDGRILEDPTGDDIRQSAVRRFHMTNGVNEYALVVAMDHSDGKGDGAGDTFANPEPALGKTWVLEGETVSCSVSGIVLETNNINLRYVTSGYYATGPPNASGNPDPHFYPKTLADLDPDDQLVVPGFTMDTWARIEYEWKSQFKISVSTLPLESVSELPLTEVLDASGQDDMIGSDMKWYNKGTELRFASYDGCLDLKGYKIIEENAVDVTPENEFFKTVDRNYTVVWEYETPSFEETVVVGSPVGFVSVPSEHMYKVNVKPLSVVNVNDPNEDAEYLYVWSQAESKFFPTVGNKVLQLEYPMGDGDCFDKMVVKVSVLWPDKGHYTHMAGTGPVSLEASPQDYIHFKELKFSTADPETNAPIASLTEAGEFQTTGPGMSSLYFTASRIPAPAMRDVSMWFDGSDDYVDCGQMLTDAYTIQAWIKFAGGSGRYDIASGASGRAFYIDDYQLCAAHTSDSGGLDTVCGPSVSAGAWTHVAVSYNPKAGTEGELYLFEGGGSYSHSGSAGPLREDRAVYIGAFNKNSNNLRGQMDEVAIFDVAKTSISTNALSTSDPDLRAYYKMDRPGDSYLHDSAEGRHAGMQGMSPYLDTPALRFSSDRNNYIEITSTPVWSGDGFTLEGWVVIDNHASDGVFLDFNNGAGVGLLLSSGTSGKPVFKTTAGSAIVSSNALPLHSQTHIAATYQGGYGRLYINGSQVAEGNMTAPPNPGASHMGGKPSGQVADALFDKVRIWTRAKSRDEIVQAMSARLTGTESDLAALYRSPEAIRGTRLKDSRDNGTVGRIYNWPFSSSWIVDTDLTSDPASGNEAVESVIIRVVESKNALDNPYTPLHSPVIGTELSSTLQDPEADPPIIYHPQARYNTVIYEASGQIFPVNIEVTDSEQIDDMLVVWRKTMDGISWPTSPARYECQWPDDSRRIVIASRYGSESKAEGGDDPRFPDMDGGFQAWFDPARYGELAVYHQNDPQLPGFNPNEEHAVIAPSFRYSSMSPRPKAVFALRNDLNHVAYDDDYTSLPRLLVQYYDNLLGRYGMEVFDIDAEDPAIAGYTFEYPMEAGEILVAPYPVNEVIGAVQVAEHIGINGDPQRRCYWEDHKGQAWAVSGNSWFKAAFWYPLAPSFWYDRDADGDGNVETAGQVVPWLWDGTDRKTFDELDGLGWKGLPTKYAEDDDPDTSIPAYPMPLEIRYNTAWPAGTPVLKAGETLTFAGGEYRADNPGNDGLPMALGWAAGQVVFDDLNPSMDETLVFTRYLVRLAQVLETRTVPLEALPADMSPATGRVKYVGGMYWFNDLHAGLQGRIFYDTLLKELGMLGFVNDKTLGDDTLTASPPSIYVLQPNIMSATERDAIKALEGADTAFEAAVDELYEATRNPVGFSGRDYTVGLEFYEKQNGDVLENAASPLKALGPGLAAMPNDDLLDPNDPVFSGFSDGYVVLAENNHPDMEALPVALHIVKVVKDKYRGAIKRVLPDNAFDEKITLRHTADFGANPEDLVFEWWYREDDDTVQPPPDVQPAAWAIFPDPSGNNGMGAVEIVMAGAGKDLLVDNFFFTRYRHKDCPAGDPACWSDWAGAANSRPPGPGEEPEDTYQAQLAEGWIKRVMMAINPFEARISDFYSSDSPATYTSMIQQAGPRYEGAVAFNPDKDVIENVGLIELYQTVLDRGKDLSIDLTQPASTSGVTAALQLAASRIAGFYALLGNEAYTDSLDPTIGFDTESGEYGSLAPTIFSFMNQMPTLLDEELALLRGLDEEGARPGYNRLLWNFTNDQGEVAYALSYDISDVTIDGFIDEADARTLYPQAHGDAWGHYLTALKTYYDLLKHPEFNWESRAESFSIEGVVVEVDYLDERKFAEIAAAKAKTGAEVVNLTYRSKYVEDPDGQWQGYRDTNSDRAWGVEQWAQRAFQGAFFDWVAANAMLPAEDTEHDGMKKIDRVTTVDIQDIAGQARFIEKQLYDANSGINPLGLATSVVPFDISPDRLDPYQTHFATHFEQVYERAEKALENARTVFDYAGDLRGRIRQVSSSTEEFTLQTMEQDRDLRNRLIEIFGTPYTGTIGTGKTYPPGYKGPDYYYYNYIDVNEVSEETVPPPDASFTAFFAPMNRTIKDPEGDPVGDGDLPALFSHFFEQDFQEGDFTALPTQDTLEIVYPVSTAADYSFQAPAEWGLRKSPGEIQEALIEMVTAEADYQLALSDYTSLMGDIEGALDLLEVTSEMQAEEIRLAEDNYSHQKSLGAAILSLRNTANLAKNYIQEDEEYEKMTISGLPTVSGLSNDVSFSVRAAVKTPHVISRTILRLGVFAAETSADGMELDRELAELRHEMDIDKTEYKYEIQQQLKEIESMMRKETGLRLEAFKRRERVRQIGEKYRAVLAKGLRLLEERKAFNARVAAKTQGNRYRDMAFRTSLDDALSLYRQMFDLAARYVYLLAKAYDYETNLSHDDPSSSIPLMTKLIRQRTLGQFKDGQVVIGQGGLGEIMGRLDANFEPLKGRMGLNNPQRETNRFSLRYELFRIPRDEAYDETWRNLLVDSTHDDLWDVPEFRKFCRPFEAETQGPQPGLVLSFPSVIVSGYNFFDNTLGGGDHSYDSSNFATKVRSVGVWFDGYDNSLLAETPRVYVFPAGMDVMYVPDSEALDTREWSILDQVLPVPIPTDSSDLDNVDYIPNLDGLAGSMSEIRRFSRILAYHDAGYFDDSQLNYDSRAIGRSVWNTRWMIVIPGATFHYDAEYGLDTFIDTVKDIKLFFETYAISGA